MGWTYQRRASKLRLPHLATALVLCAWLPTAVAAAEPSSDATESVSARDAFAQLKSLAGLWSGEGEHQHTINLSAAGTVVMETMAPGTDHEMINMYFLDGERLLLTHYCAGGNQPQMELQSQSTRHELHFDYVGGTNLDPAVDSHIHSAKIVLVDPHTIESHWNGYQDGKPHHDMVFHLKRHDG